MNYLNIVFSAIICGLAKESMNIDVQFLEHGKEKQLDLVQVLHMIITAFWAIKEEYKFIMILTQFL